MFMRRDLQFQQMLATPPLAGQPAHGPPAGPPAWADRYGNVSHMPPSEQRVESQRAQQQYMQRQQAEAVSMMQRDRIDIPNANWTPPW